MSEDHQKAIAVQLAALQASLQEAVDQVCEIGKQVADGSAPPPEVAVGTDQQTTTDKLPDDFVSVGTAAGIARKDKSTVRKMCKLHTIGQPGGFLGVRLCHVHRLINQKLIKVFTLPGLSTRCARKSDLAAITDGCKAAAAAAADKQRKIIAKKQRDRYHSRKRGN